MLVNTLGTGPLCPQSTPPVHAAHAVRERVFDGFFEAARGEGTEMPPAADQAYHAAARKVSAEMSLYVANAEGMVRGTLFEVRAAWFRCPTCGFVLPAELTQRAPATQLI